LEVMGTYIVSSKGGAAAALSRLVNLDCYSFSILLIHCQCVSLLKKSRIYCI
jgi:hypothetical protein